jgi:hypothetical protein
MHKYNTIKKEGRGKGRNKKEKEKVFKKNFFLAYFSVPPPK